MTGIIGNTDPGGQVGGRVARRLSALGVRQRLVAEAGLDNLPALAGAETERVAGYGDVAGMTKALRGVETLLLMPIRECEDRAQLHASAVDAALAAGVRRIVYSSFIGASAMSTFTFARDHYATEQRIRSTGVPCTFVRGSAYLEVLHWIIGDEGVIRGPGGAGRLAPLPRDDLADVLTEVLTGDGAHDGLTYDVTGPEFLSLNEIAAAFAKASGVPVRYVEESVEQAYASRAGYGAPDWQLQGWVTTYLSIASGELDVVTDTVRRLTGHPAVSLADYLASNPGDYPQLRTARVSVDAC